MKRIFRFGTKAIKKTASSVIEGIDEGLNGDDIKDVRQERRYIRQDERNDRSRQEKIVGYAWTLAWLAILSMCAKTIYENGFNNNAVSNIWSDYSIALAFPLLIAGIVSLLKKQL